MDFACCAAYIILYVIYTGCLAAVLDLVSKFFFVINNFEIRFSKVIIVAIIVIIKYHSYSAPILVGMPICFCLPKPVTKNRC